MLERVRDVIIMLQVWVGVRYTAFRDSWPTIVGMVIGLGLAAFKSNIPTLSMFGASKFV